MLEGREIRSGHFKYLSMNGFNDFASKLSLPPKTKGHACAGDKDVRQSCLRDNSSNTPRSDRCCPLDVARTGHEAEVQPASAPIRMRTMR